MEKYIEVMKKSLELSETILEGLQHIQKPLSEGMDEQTVLLFEDIVIAYNKIEQSLGLVIKELNNESIPSSQAEFNKAIEVAVTAYEEKNYAKVQETFQFMLVPRFKKLKQELEQAFNPYIVS